MSEIEVREAGQRVRVPVGERVAVVLPEAATGGYEWAIEHVDPGLELESSALTPAATAAPGAAAERRLVFRATAGGQATLRLRLERPWESQAKRRFELTVIVP
jgi:predicted secreted protein